MKEYKLHLECITGYKKICEVQETLEKLGIKSYTLGITSYISEVKED